MALKAAGSQNCPIDIEDEERTIVPPRRKKRKRKTPTSEDEVEVEYIGEKCEERKPKKESKHGKIPKVSSFASQKSLKELLDKFTSLENRLESLETCLERVSQVFVNTSFYLKADDENSECKEEPAVTVKQDENLSKDVSENDSNENNAQEEISIGLDRAANDESENQNISATSENSELINCQNNSGESIISQPNPCNEFENNDSSHMVESLLHDNNQNDSEVSAILPANLLNEFEEHGESAARENIQHSVCQNNIDASVPNEVNASECLQDTRKTLSSLNDIDKHVVGDKPVNSDLHLLDVTSIKREVALHRDDQGRILMFLSCAFKKLYKPETRIAATSGVYIGDEFKNEYNFVSTRKMSEVKMEAEIRAALFGIELIKGLFHNAFDKVCIMSISSCPSLVKIMKERAFSLIYPKMYSCACEIVECNHTDRWISTHPLAVSQQDCLPKLIMSMKGVQVHWCTVDRISDEEKKILEKYSIAVQSSLNEHFALLKSR